MTVDSASQLVYFASDPAFAIDGELRVRSWNPQVETLLGYSGEEAIGLSCYDVLRAVLPSGEPLCAPDCAPLACFIRRTPFSAQEVLCRHKNGQWIAAALGSVAVPRADREDGVVAVLFLRPLDEASRGEGTTADLRAFTLGHFALALGDQGIALQHWERKQAVTLFKYLVTRRGYVAHRERLIECLWPNVTGARGRDRLKVTVYALRRELRTAGVPEEIVGTEDGGYVLHREALWVDTDSFEARVSEGNAARRQQRETEALRCYEEADSLYRGDFLEGDVYADWCAEERERLREVYLETTAKMAHLYTVQDDYDRAAQTCRKALVREPCRETFHRTLMLSLWHQGRRDEALAQYQTCRRVLAAELSVQPMPETQRLYGQIQHAPPGKPTTATL
ncbi:MAG: hypothetical protein CL878_09155 [Dehalococcoidia bacterium]|nr:hypothetical protein [Dehalococcoidia bacterium]